MSSRAAQRFSVLAVCMKHLCAVTINPFISNVESFNCRAGPCRGLCERTWRHTKLRQLWGSLLFISYPALRCLMAVRGSSPPLPLRRSQIMIRKDANGKEYNDYQAAAPKCVSKRGWRGLIGCDAEMHFIFRWRWRSSPPQTCTHQLDPPPPTFGAPFRCFCSTAERKKVQKGRTWWVCLLLVLVYVMIDWRNIWQPRKQGKKPLLFCCLSHQFTSTQRSAQIRCINSQQLIQEELWKYEDQRDNERKASCVRVER